MNPQDVWPEFYSNEEQPPRKVFLKRYLPSLGFSFLDDDACACCLPPLRMSSRGGVAAEQGRHSPWKGRGGTSTVS